jgi:hypothetical protein
LALIHPAGNRDQDKPEWIQNGRHLVASLSVPPNIPGIAYEQIQFFGPYGAFTELHALALADLDGDGLQDIVTGKRWWSHGLEHSENDVESPGVMYWFKLVRKPGGQVEFVPHLINNYVALGTQIQAVDVNGDGRPDVLTAARKGAFIFFNNVKR